MANPAYSATAWADAAAAADHWPDVADLTPAVQTLIFSAATRVAKRHTPALDPDTTPITDDMVLAVIYLARDLRAAILRGDTDVVGIGDYALRARPLSAIVRSLLPRKWAVG